MTNRILLVFALFVLPFIGFSQEEGEEDNTKMVREVVTVMVDKAKFAAPTPPPPAEDHSKKGGKKKKHHEEPPPTEPTADTGATTMPAPISELVKRANNWSKFKNNKYKKVNAVNSGSNITVTAEFPYKQKVLNPENDVDGSITMDVIIEAKDGKYRYTIKNIKHKANKPGMSGGDIYLQVPECGSMKINEQTWKHIKSAAFTDIAIVQDELKAKMKEDGDKKKDEW
jgi:hypothetical protein